MGNFQTQLVSIGLHRPTLDDVFLKLTGRAIREEEAGSKETSRTKSVLLNEQIKRHVQYVCDEPKRCRRACAATVFDV